jgi:hypothetical protein
MIFLAKLLLSGTSRPLLFRKSLKALNKDASGAVHQTQNNNNNNV